MLVKSVYHFFMKDNRNSKISRGETAGGKGTSAYPLLVAFLDLLISYRFESCACGEHESGTCSLGGKSS